MFNRRRWAFISFSKLSMVLTEIRPCWRADKNGVDGNRLKLARSQGNKIQITAQQEYSRYKCTITIKFSFCFLHVYHNLIMLCHVSCNNQVIGELGTGLLADGQVQIENEIYRYVCDLFTKWLTFRTYNNLLFW